MIDRTRLRWLGLALLIILLAAGCNPTATPEATGLPTNQPTEDLTGYPVPTDPGPGYPVENTELDVFQANLTPVAPTPEVSESLGGLSILLVYENTDNRPVRGQLVFAAEMRPVDGVEDGFIPILDQTVNRSGTTDSLGQLHISWLEPGRYSLALISPLGPILLEESGTGDPVVFDITANTITDLGAVVVRLDPVPLEP